MGFVAPLSPSVFQAPEAEFWKRLRELGWIEGDNLVIEKRSAEGRLERLSSLMVEVINRKVDVLVTYGVPAGVAAKKATSTVPIVDAIMNDPVREGLAASLARPGGNLTGMATGWAEGYSGKWLELLQETSPRLSSVAVVFNPNNPWNRGLAQDIKTVAASRGLKLHFIEVRGPDALDLAFEQAQSKARAVVVLGEPFTIENRARVTAMVAKYRLSAIYPQREFVTEAGGLMFYGPDVRVMFRRAADSTDKILIGAKPADLPIEQPTQHQLIVNLRTAKALGITIPESILLRADEVIR
ncbi:MAG TPA: ABC transporter substrate-binding protein [Burkholderiales bacterium]|nr:ABC transporter substrate-binding protein [Burkholderiales bacterium]